jgi:hypothetical protein
MDAINDGILINAFRFRRFECNVNVSTANGHIQREGLLGTNSVETVDANPASVKPMLGAAQYAML